MITKSPSLRPYVLLGLIVLALRLVTALPLEQAGYMDASYTLHVGRNLAHGRGFVQDIVWNYLDGPLPIPQPEQLVLAAAARRCWRDCRCRCLAIRIAPRRFLLFCSRSCRRCLRFIWRDAFMRATNYAWMAGLLTAFSGFYTIYWNSPDNFTPFAVTAGLALLFLAIGVIENRPKHFLLAGHLCGAVATRAHRCTAAVGGCRRS